MNVFLDDLDDLTRPEDRDDRFVPHCQFCNAEEPLSPFSDGGFDTCERCHDRLVGDPCSACGSIGPVRGVGRKSRVTHRYSLQLCTPCFRRQFHVPLPPLRLIEDVSLLG